MLVTITGLPYAGKTTLRKFLVNKFGWKVVSVDELNDKSGIPESQDEWNHVYKKAYKNLEEYLLNGYSVVFDGGSLLKKDRKKQKQIAAAAGTKTILVYVKASLATTKQRREENLKTQKRKHVRDDLFNMAVSMFEEPTPDEKPIIYETDTDKEKWIKKFII